MNSYGFISLSGFLNIIINCRFYNNSARFRNVFRLSFNTGPCSELITIGSILPGTRGFFEIKWYYGATTKAQIWRPRRVIVCSVEVGDAAVEAPLPRSLCCTTRGWVTQHAAVSHVICRYQNLYGRLLSIIERYPRTRTRHNGIPCSRAGLVTRLPTVW